MQWNISHKKNKILPFAATWVDLKGIMLNEIRQREKGKYYVMLLICHIYSKKQNTKLIEKDKISGYKRWQVWGDVEWWRYWRKVVRGTNFQL